MQTILSILPIMSLNSRAGNMNSPLATFEEEERGKGGKGGRGGGRKGRGGITKKDPV